MDRQQQTELPAAPPHLTGEARIAWDEITRQLERRDGFVAEWLLPLVELYAVTYGRWRQANDQIEQDGAIVEGRQGGKVKHPATAVAHSTGEALARMLVQLGFTCTASKKIEKPVDWSKNPLALLKNA